MILPLVFFMRVIGKKLSVSYVVREKILFCVWYFFDWRGVSEQVLMKKTSYEINFIYCVRVV